MVALFQARLIVGDPTKPDDRGIAHYLAGAGADYYPALTGSWNGTTTYNPGAGIGKLKYVQSYWRLYTMSTLTESQLRGNPPPISSLGNPDVIAPSVPANLSVIAVSSSQINLFWAPSTDNVGVAGYFVYLNGAQIATTTSTSYSNTGLTPSTAYSYTVAAYDAAGNVSAQSAAASATTLGTGGSAINLSQGILPTSHAPAEEGTLVMATDGNLNSANYVNISSGPQWLGVDLGKIAQISDIKLWHYYADGRTYHDVVVQLSDDPNFASGVTTVFNNDTTNAVGQGVGSNAAYPETSAGKDIAFNPVSARYVRMWSDGSTVNMWNHYVEVQIYGTAAASVDTTPPSTPTGLTATGISSSLQVNLSWTASTDPDNTASQIGYAVYRNGSLVGMAPAGTTNYSNTGLTASTTYSYTISASDPTGNMSAQSASVSATTFPATPVFAIGAQVKTTASLSVRTQACTSSHRVGTQPLGVTGTIIGGPKTGCGYTWWNVNFATGADGWSAQNWLIPVLAANTLPAVAERFVPQQTAPQVSSQTISSMAYAVEQLGAILQVLQQSVGK
jgi:chitodextrinase